MPLLFSVFAQSFVFPRLYLDDFIICMLCSVYFQKNAASR